MMDIIEIALEHYTDFRRFEQLSIEILKLNGFENIIPVGGIDDDGIDAILVKYYHDETKTTVFQITLQDNINAKVYDTIRKLEANAISFNELIIVSSNQINNIQAIKAKVRTKFSNRVKLEIIERSTFVTTLSTRNDIFTRYFGDIQKQLTGQLFERKTIFTDASNETLTNSLLKCSLLFTFNKDGGSTRKALFDRTVLAIFVDLKSGIAEDVVNVFSDKFFKVIPIDKVSSAIDRLKKSGLLTKKSDGKFEPSKNSIEKIESNVSKINQGTKALINDIVLNVVSIYPDKIDNASTYNIEQNVKNGLSLFFRLHGLEYSDESMNPLFKNLDDSISTNADITAIIRKGLSKPLGDALLYSLGEIIKNPSDAQAETLAEWSKAFIGAQIMSLDPSLKEFQLTNLTKKTFILDTDFLLYCIVGETKISPIYRSLLSELIKSRCQVEITEDVVYEVIKHAEFAERNYNYFKNTFDVIDDLVIDEKISNIFVKGYYSARKLNSTLTFKTYLSNYYDPDNGYEFLCEFIKTYLSKSIIFKTIEEIETTQIPDELLTKLSSEVYKATIKTAKAQYRTEDENKSIAATDAKQYLTAYFLNKKISNSQEVKILPGDFYLVTSSIRTLRCAYMIGLKQNVTVNPSALLNIFEQIGLFTMSAKETVNLFDNPFLIDVVNENWLHIKHLVNAGVDLKDKNIVRLKKDLKDAIHEHLSSDNSSDDLDEISDETDDINTKLEFDEYLKFAKIVKEKGYSFTPEIESLMLKFKELEEKSSTQENIIADLQKQAGVHIKKTQYYLNRVNRKRK